MEIIVCIKPVPDPREARQIAVNMETRTMERTGVPAVINPLDRHALEEAARIKERFGGRITALSMAPAASMAVLKESLAMGADRLVVLSDRRFAGSDTLATASIIAAAIRHLGSFDCVLCGNETADSGTAQVSPQIAEFLGIPNLAGVIGCEPDGSGLFRVRSRVEGGYVIAEAKAPLVLAVTSEINEPRYVTLMDILDSEGKEVRLLSADDIHLNEPWMGMEGSPTRVLSLNAPERKTHAEMLAGDARGQARILADRLRRMGFYHG